MIRLRTFIQEGISIRNGEINIDYIDSPDDIISLAMGKLDYTKPLKSNTKNLSSEDRYLDFKDDYDISIKRDLFDKAINAGFSEKEIVNLIKTKKLEDTLKSKESKSKYAKEPYVSSGKYLSGVKVYSAYSYKNRSEINNILLAVKGKATEIGQLPADIIKKFISRTAIYLWSKVLKGKGIDTIVTIKSTSGLGRDFATEFIERISNTIFISDVFIKNALDKIKISDLASPEQKKSLERIIDKAKKEDGDFEMKKVAGSQRSLLSDFMKLDKDIQSKVKGKTILIVDDYLTTGASLGDIIRILNVLEPKEIVGATIFKQAN